VAKDPDHIFNWQRIDPRTTTSGRLSAGDVVALADLGVRHVINLAVSDSPGALADEEVLMARHGLRYTHVPVPFDAPEEGHYRAFRTALEADDEPVQSTASPTGASRHSSIAITVSAACPKPTRGR
jgi:protein tyrosine phosphatase (PTP) superfamily phosphohydrolase (DUF442 family)